MATRRPSTDWLKASQVETDGQQSSPGKQRQDELSAASIEGAMAARPRKAPSLRVLNDGIGSGDLAW